MYPRIADVEVQAVIPEKDILGVAHLVGRIRLPLIIRPMDPVGRMHGPKPRQNTGLDLIISGIVLRPEPVARIGGRAFVYINRRALHALTLIQRGHDVVRRATLERDEMHLWLLPGDPVFGLRIAETNRPFLRTARFHLCAVPEPEVPLPFPDHRVVRPNPELLPRLVRPEHWLGGLQRRVHTEVDAGGPIKEARVDEKLLPVSDMDCSGHEIPLPIVDTNYKKFA